MNESNADYWRDKYNAEHRARIAEQNARWHDRVTAGKVIYDLKVSSAQDRAYARAKYAELRAERDTIAAAYRALLDTLNKPQRQPKRQPVVNHTVDLSNMSDEQIRQYIIDNPGLVQVKG